MKLQDELNKLDRKFQPKKSPRTVYVQPKRVNGRTEYQQPKRGDNNG